MRLLELRLHNFRQHADTHIRFPTGLTGVIGPNGAGKSTLLEAIAWALYGAEATRGTNDTLRHARADPGARVEAELRFELAGHELRVARTLTTAEVRVDGRVVSAAKTLAASSEFLQRRLGMSRREFFSTYFTGQKDLQFLASLGPTERGRFLSTVLGFDRLRIAQGLARRRRGELRNRVEGLRAGLPDEEAVRAARAAAEEELGAAQAAAEAASRAREAARLQAERATPRWEEARRASERRNSAAAELEVATRAAAVARREVERLEAELARADEAQAELERVRVELQLLPDLLRRCDHLDALARTHERRRALAEEVREIGLELDRSLERLSRLEKAPELLQRYAAEVASAREAQEAAERMLEEKKTSWLRDRQDAETKLQSYRDRAVELQDEVRRVRGAGPEGKCPTCQRPLGADYERLIASLEEQWAEVTQDGRWWRSRHDQLAEKPSEVAELETRAAEAAERVEEKARRHARCEAALHELAVLQEERATRMARRDVLRGELEALPAGYDAGEHSTAEAALRALRQVEQRAAVLEEAVKREAEWRKGLGAARHSLSGAEQQAAAATAALADGAAGMEEYEVVREEAETAERELRLAEVAAAAAQERLRVAERDAAAARSAEAALEARLAQIEEEVTELRHHNELDSAFSRLRAELNARVRPELGEIASQLMGQLTDGRYGTVELDDSYRIVVMEDGIARPVISGGEEDVANLVLRISLSQMIAERAGHPLSMLVLDEVFGSLDVVRRENVVRLLRRLGGRFEQVLLVTHLEEVRGAMDHVLRVDLDEATGRSVVRWEGRLNEE